MSYHIGLVKDGDRLIVEVARNLDQLNCELWKYYGERETTIAALKRNSAAILEAVNCEFGKQFRSVVIRRIASGDFTAGHRETTLSEEARS